MVATTKSSKPNRSGQRFWSDRFYAILLALSGLVLLFGAVGFVYLAQSSPSSLIAGSDRPIAAASLFVPSQSPFSISLLTQPEKLITFVQSLEEPDQRQRTLQEVAQIEQHFLNKTGLSRLGIDYESAIQPWLGDEATFAFVDADLDSDRSNGNQPGYLAALEIAPERQLEAKEFLQLFWQQQALAGNELNSQALSGVRILSTPSARSQSVRATALVGDQLMLLANDSRVLQRSIQVAQTTKNLAQNFAYRRAVADLPTERIGLAYFDLDLLNDENSALFSSRADESFTAVSIGLTKTGLIADALISNEKASAQIESSKQVKTFEQTAEALKFLPAESKAAIASQDLSWIKSKIVAIGLSEATLAEGAVPALFRSVLFQSALSRPALPQTKSGGDSDDNPWDWASGDYALGKIGEGKSGWVLAVERDEAGIAALDEQAIALGYSKSLVSIGEATATAWTRLTTSKSGRRSISELQTELLGLHVQQGQYEIFTDSLAALSSVLAIAETSPVKDSPIQDPLTQDSLTQDSLTQDSLTSNALIESARFKRATKPLTTPNQGYVYLDWPTVAPAISRRFPIIDQAVEATEPLFSHVDTVAATYKGKIVNLFAHFKQ